ncbi:hypothetical protein BDK51DRAFT_43612 [Blyttiomyces helicus]|uniref:Uncharacterized protein n=1 Tax=Blyttiomyces helicus TaxID=388810 RepID=A0A4V1ISA1_9FUNG|nr:hypothetical protein BDK51DRAFT_43612 [Blyttiomyces helicus]|eukprot:RKO92837.1 hypothetical protein BDK51DRAFT_43612 [Blyttiomyces helicus]
MKSKEYVAVSFGTSIRSPRVARRFSSFEDIGWSLGGRRLAWNIFGRSLPVPLPNAHFGGRAVEELVPEPGEELDPSALMLRDGFGRAHTDIEPAEVRAVSFEWGAKDQAPESRGSPGDADEKVRVDFGQESKGHSRKGQELETGPARDQNSSYPGLDQGNLILRNLLDADFKVEQRGVALEHVEDRITVHVVELNVEMCDRTTAPHQVGQAAVVGGHLIKIAPVNAAQRGGECREFAEIAGFLYHRAAYNLEKL